jgi:hypothetical protein
MITPARLSNPKITKKSNAARMRNSPRKGPVKARGIVMKKITGQAFKIVAFVDEQTEWSLAFIRRGHCENLGQT